MGKLIFKWKAGQTGSWTDKDNWQNGKVPAPGDTAIIGSGNPVVGSASPVTGVDIVLGGSSASTSVTLTANHATFEGSGTSAAEINTTLSVSGGDPGTSPLEATLIAHGETSFDGQVFVGAMAGGLTIDASGDGNSFALNNDDGKAVMVVYQESTLSFSGGRIFNSGILQIEGGLNIASGVDFESGTQDGHVLLESGGNASIGGTFGASQELDFIDNTGVATLRSGSAFSGTFGFTGNANGSTIDVQGIAASTVNVVAAAGPHTPAVLQLQDGSNNTLASYQVQLIASDFSFSPLPFDDQKLAAGDFKVTPDGAGGSLITYTPQTAQILQQSLAVPVVASAGTMVSLASILEQSFGTAAPGFYSITLQPPDPWPASTTNVGYWSSPEVTPTWYVDGQPITQSTVVTDISRVQLKVGNQIIHPAQFQAQVTALSQGPSAEYVDYGVWSVDPAIAQGVADKGFGGLPTPGAVVASAETFAATYPLIPNTGLCDWIADNVGVGAGAPMPPADASIDPSLNESGGFWRVVYTGASSDPVSKWSTLVKPGDIVRMGWFKPELPDEVASGHSTTVLGTVDKSGRIKFYDNNDHIDGVPYIGIHKTNYWLRTDPADITIYRLDPDNQYLIQGSSLGEFIQGSVYDDLIQPGGGADTIATGPGRDEIQGTAAELDGITVTDFAVGDSLDFTDLDPGQTSISYSAGALHVVSNGAEVATLSVAKPRGGRSYVLSADGNGGSMVQLLDSVTLHGSYAGGYAVSPDVLNLLIDTDATVQGGGVSAAAAHVTNIVNLGAVASLGNGITLLGGGSIVNGSATNSAASINGENGTAIRFGGPGTITNYGVIEGVNGIEFDGPGTLVNFGTIRNDATSDPPARQYLIAFDDAGARLVLEGTSVLTDSHDAPGKIRGGGGTLELGALAGPGTLDGLGSAVTGFATVMVDKNATWNFGTAASVLANGTTLDNSGSLSLRVSLSAKGAIENNKGATLALGGDVGITGSAAIDNNGVLQKTAGTGISVVSTGTGAGSFTSPGKIDVQTGTLKLIGAAVGISGAVTGAGTMLFGKGETTLAHGTSLTVASLGLQGTGAHVTIASSLAYAGSFSAKSNAELSVGAAQRFTLTGAANLDGAMVDGSGRFETDGATTASRVSLGGAVEWDNDGALTLAGDLTLGAAAHFVNRVDGSVTLSGKVGLNGAAGADILNQGTISKSGKGTSAIAVAIRNNGTLEAAGGTLDLQQAVTGRGNLAIDGGILEADAAVAASVTVQFTGSKAQLVLTDAPSFAGKLASFGAGDRLDLRQFDPATATIAFRENASGTQGRLTVSDGSLSATLTLLGQFAAAGFHGSADGLGGTNITYTEPSASLLIAASPH